MARSQTVRSLLLQRQAHIARIDLRDALLLVQQNTGQDPILKLQQ
jgi:hypothetical protein